MDLLRENLVTLSEAARALPSRRKGKSVHPSTLHRWALRGVGGHRLETVRIGGTAYTSREALERFAERLTAAPCAFQPTTLAKKVAVDEVESTLDGLGL